MVTKNIVLTEIERAVLNLYTKNLITKDEIKELINSLKFTTEKLPDNIITYLN